MRLLVVAALVACKGDTPPPKTEPVRPPLSVAVEVRGPAQLVLGTGKVALRAGDRWFDFVDGKPVENAATAAAITTQLAAMGGEADIFLGATPILVGGEHHHEKHLRPDGTRIDIHGVALEIVSMRGGTEVWRYDHELASQVALVMGLTVTEMPSLELVAPELAGMSPVSRRKCAVPQIVDLDASEFAYALVVECNEAAPIRVMAYERADQRVRDIRLPSPEALRFKPQVLAVRDKRVDVVGIRAPDLLAVTKLVDGTTPDGTVTTTLAGVSRVLAAVIADDGALWVLATTNDGIVVTRDGKPVPLDGKRPAQLGFDRTLGVVVLVTGINAQYLLAEHATTPLVITPPR